MPKASEQTKPVGEMTREEKRAYLEDGGAKPTSEAGYPHARDEVKPDHPHADAMRAEGAEIPPRQDLELNPLAKRNPDGTKTGDALQATAEENGLPNPTGVETDAEQRRAAENAGDTTAQAQSNTATSRSAEGGADESRGRKKSKSEANA